MTQIFPPDPSEMGGKYHQIFPPDPSEMGGKYHPNFHFPPKIGKIKATPSKIEKDDDGGVRFSISVKWGWWKKRVFSFCLSTAQKTMIFMFFLQK